MGEIITNGEVDHIVQMKIDLIVAVLFTMADLLRLVNQYNNTGGGYIYASVMLTVWNSDGTVSWSKWMEIDGHQNNSQIGTGTYISSLSSSGGVDGSNNVYALVYKGLSVHMIKFNSSGTVQWKKNFTDNNGYNRGATDTGNKEW